MIGDRIRALRRKTKISQTALSKAIGVTQSAVGMWETNKREPDLATLQKIASFFDVSVSEIVGDFESPPQSAAFGHPPIQQDAPGITESEREILALFRRLTDIQRGELIGRAKVMAEQNAAEQAACAADENVS